MKDFSKVKQAIEDIKNGKIIIVTDNEARENEGDFICSAEFATPENINFIATYGKGLICLPMSHEIVTKLSLHPITDENNSAHKTPFMTPIDYIETKTGISAYERSLTAIKVVQEGTTSKDFMKPGHMFPLEAKENGVLERAGHTEATVDLVKLAGLKACGVCCEIMEDDGHMMKDDRLNEIAKKFGLTKICIDELIEYRLATEHLVQKISSAKLPTKYGDFEISTFENKINNLIHVVLTKGDFKPDEEILCRIHSSCLTGDVFGSDRCDCGEQLQIAMKKIEQEGKGIIIYSYQEGRGIGIVNKIKAYKLQEEGLDTVDANLKLGFKADLRDYRDSVDILNQFGISKVRLLTNNPDKINNLKKYGIDVTERISIQVKPNKYNLSYLLTKQNRMGHLTNYEEL